MDVYDIAQTIIVIEFLIIMSVVLATYFSIIIIFLMKKRAKKLKGKAEKFLTTLILQKERFQRKQFLPAWERLDLLISLLNKMDEEVARSDWEKIKNDLLHEIVLPLARKSALDASWPQRLLAAKSFCFLCEKGDERLVEKLANDDNDLVSLNAGRATINHASEQSIRRMVDRIHNRRWLSQKMFLSVFDHAPLIICHYVADYLGCPIPDPYIRSTCYRILLKYPKSSIPRIDIYPDLQSNNMDLKLKALKFLSHAFSLEEAMPILEENLSSNAWEVKVVALNGLKQLHASESDHQIEKLLRDPNWWVRLRAAETLNSFGERGRQILQRQDVHLDAFAYDISQHVLSYQP